MSKDPLRMSPNLFINASYWKQRRLNSMCIYSSEGFFSKTETDHSEF